MCESGPSWCRNEASIAVSLSRCCGGIGESLVGRPRTTLSASDDRQSVPPAGDHAVRPDPARCAAAVVGRDRLPAARRADRRRRAHDGLAPRLSDRRRARQRSRRRVRGRARGRARPGPDGRPLRRREGVRAAARAGAALRLPARRLAVAAPARRAPAHAAAQRALRGDRRPSAAAQRRRLDPRARQGDRRRRALRRRGAPARLRRRQRRRRRHRGRRLAGARAQASAALAHRSPVRFVLFDGEEEPPDCLDDARFTQCALRGSKAYAKRHADETLEPRAARLHRREATASAFPARGRRTAACGSGCAGPRATSASAGCSPTRRRRA